MLLQLGNFSKHIRHPLKAFIIKTKEKNIEKAASFVVVVVYLCFFGVLLISPLMETAVITQGCSKSLAGRPQGKKKKRRRYSTFYKLLVRRSSEKYGTDNIVSRRLLHHYSNSVLSNCKNSLCHLHAN